MITDTERSYTISVIVPVRNEPPESLDNLSCLSECREITEIIVVDCSSQQQTIDKLNRLQLELARVKVIHTEIPGRALQMNVGTAHSKGDLLWFIHADTQVPLEGATIVSKSVTPEQQWGRFDVRFNTNSQSMKIVAFAMNLRSAITSVCTGDQAIFVTRELFTEIGGFPELAIMEDVALCKKLKQKSRMIRVQSQVTTSARRWETHGYLWTIVQMWMLRFLFWVRVSPHKLAKLYR